MVETMVATWKVEQKVDSTAGLMADSKVGHLVVLRVLKMVDWTAGMLAVQWVVMKAENLVD